MLTERSQLGAVAGWYISPESLQKGYDPGIDDYMVKSGDFSGLFMRVRALLRRANIEASRKLSVDGLLLYADALTASLAGAEIPVTIREFNILYELLSAAAAQEAPGQLPGAESAHLIENGCAGGKYCGIISILRSLVAAGPRPLLSPAAAPALSGLLRANIQLPGAPQCAGLEITAGTAASAAPRPALPRYF